MTAPHAPNERLTLGIAGILIGMLAMTLMDAAAKWLGEGYPIVQVVFFRNLFGLLPMVIMIWKSGGLSSLRITHWPIHLLRSLSGVVAIFSFFFALRYMGLAEAMAIAFLAPIFVTALSNPVLGEKVGPRRWAAVAAGFVGALIAIQPESGGTFHWAVLLPALAALAYATLMIYGRKIAPTNSNVALVFYGTIGGLVVSGVLLPFYWVTPTLEDLYVFVAMGVVGTSGSYLMMVGYRNGPAAVIAPFEYSSLIWGVLFGWIFWQELPTLNVWIGAGIIAAAGLYILYRETRQPKGAQ
ncbi:DMT family transporter [Rhodovibrionaceae bacterium A322]